MTATETSTTTDMTLDDNGARLRSVIERVERLEEERAALASDIKDVFAEAKSAGYDVRVLRQIIRLRKQSPEETEEQDVPREIYLRAIEGEHAK